MCIEGARESMGNGSFAFSAQSTAGFPAFSGRRDIVAMAKSEAGSSSVLEGLCVLRHGTWEGSGSKGMGEHLLSKMRATLGP